MKEPMHPDKQQPIRSEGHSPDFGNHVHLPVSAPIASASAGRGAGLTHPVELRIEEFVLHGFALGDRHNIGDSVERELSRLLIKRGMPPSLAHGPEVENLDAGEFDVTSDASPKAIGLQVARRLYGALSR